jgi:acetylornithine deacetylase/succinyl-diaminopimelate desuccinylase-like protein
MSREAAIAHAEKYFDSGEFKRDLARRVAIPTESQNPERAEAMVRYIDEMRSAFEALGFACKVLTHPRAKGPFLYAERIEGEGLLTVLGYGHGDVIRGLEAGWDRGLNPWELTEVDGRYYGRGTADNKGQHTMNLAAQAAVIATRGRLGFNAKWLIEMGEEVGSPGLREVCAEHRELLKSDVLIGSDGPRLAIDKPIVSLGTRGAMNIDLEIVARAGGHHSGNWGGLLSSPAIQMAHALASIAGPTGQIRIPEWVPPPISASVKRALAECEVVEPAEGPKFDSNWSEPGLTLAEKVFGWSSFDILAMTSGNPQTPVNAVPPRAWARVQLRYVVGVDKDRIIPALRAHLDRHGFPFVTIEMARDEAYAATRLDPEHPWAQWAADALRRSTNLKVAVLPNVGGSLPNDIFSDGLGLPTIWIPHSYPGCSQHAPNEHLPVVLAREGLRLMAGLYWDLGEPGAPSAGAR